jgi:hypothetical protein
MRPGAWLFPILLGLWACDRPVTSPHPPRAQLRPVTGNTFELVPSEGQLPWCLVFSRSKSGVVRQLTMTHENKSVPCAAGSPIAGVRFRAPEDEGDLQVHIFFSDRKLNAASIAQQLHDIGATFHPMDHRLPGVVFAESLFFSPQKDDAAITTGVVVDANGQPQPQPAGAPGRGAP